MTFDSTEEVAVYLCQQKEKWNPSVTYRCSAASRKSRSMDYARMVLWYRLIEKKAIYEAPGNLSGAFCFGSFQQEVIMEWFCKNFVSVPKWLRGLSAKEIFVSSNLTTDSHIQPLWKFFRVTSTRSRGMAGLRNSRDEVWGTRYEVWGKSTRYDCS